jgi:hypothetical protein
MPVVGVPDARRRQRRSLFQGGKLRCPHDKQLRHIEEYKTFDRNPEFSQELNPVFKCKCGHVFSPGITDEEMRSLVTNGA